jgi:hypothetical protein
VDACGPSTIVDAPCAKRRLRVFLLRDGGVGFSGRDCVGLGGQRERAGVTRTRPSAMRRSAGLDEWADEECAEGCHLFFSRTVGARLDREIPHALRLARQLHAVHGAALPLLYVTVPPREKKSVTPRHACMEPWK